MWFLLISVFFGVTVGSRKDNLEQQYYRLPEYTQLDDYDQCLTNNNGLYCLGTFRIYPNLNDQETYNFIKEYSNQSLTFDRTLFHRGYCVNSRCSPHSNAMKRFEYCVQRWALERNLNASLETLHYCRTQKKSAVLDRSSQAFLLVILLLVMVNIVGTIFDIKIKDGTKSKLITSWSIRSNWKQLVGPFGYDPDMTSLAPIQIMRVVLMSIVILIHVIVILEESYLDNPLSIEQILKTPFKIILIKWASVVQIFYALSSFLTAYNLLLLSKRQNLGLWMLPKQFLKRYFRIAPVHILFIGFAATLWPHISDGPMWSVKIDSDSATCRRKFWYHFFHVHNLFEPCQFCLPQTWSLAVDMQFQLVSLVLTILMTQYNLPKLKTLLCIFFSSCALNAGLAYANGWKPLIHQINEFDIAKSFHQDTSYVSHFYMSPWGSLPSCLVGLIMGHIYYQQRQEGFKVCEHKWLCFICRYSLPFLLLWILAGYLTKDVESPLLLALHLSIDRPVFCIIPCIWLFGMISSVNIYPGFKRLSRRIWMPLGRLSLSVLVVHWVVISTRTFSLPHPTVFSIQNIISEFIVSWFLSYSLAVPITILVELPMQNTFTYISSLDFRYHKGNRNAANKIFFQKED